MEVVSISPTAGDLDPEVIVIGEVRHPQGHRRLMRTVQRGRTFMNDLEVFQMSRTKARKLAHRWRGSRRGARIRAWLARTRMPEGVTMESPVASRVG